MRHPAQDRRWCCGSCFRLVVVGQLSIKIAPPTAVPAPSGVPGIEWRIARRTWGVGLVAAMAHSVINKLLRDLARNAFQPGNLIGVGLGRQFTESRYGPQRNTVINKHGYTTLDARFSVYGHR